MFYQARRFVFALILGCFSFSLVNPTESYAASKDVSIKGAALSVAIKEDLAGTRFEMEYRIKKNGKSYRLNFPKGKEPKGLHSGMLVNVKGKQTSSAAITVGSTSGSFAVVGGSEIAGAGGVRQVIVLKIQSTTAVSSASVSAIASAMQAMDTWYQESSYGMLSVKNDLQGDGVPDIYTVSINSASAGVTEGSAFSFCSSAESAASSQLSINTSLWTHVICILPPDMTYSWFGQAYISGRQVVINGNYAGGYPGGYTHEVGHNLGMHHSNTPGTEYGESSCVMGGNAGTSRRDFNGLHKTQMAWLTAENAGTGSYELSAVEAQPANRLSTHSVMKMRDAIANEDIYITYRAPLGTFGSGLSAPYTTSVHSWSGGAVQTVLLATLGDGQTFTRNGISVTQTGHTTLSGSVSIGAVCSAAAPTVTLAPSSTVTRTAQSVSYTVSVKNNDVNCTTPVDFALSGVVPSGWIGSLASPTVTVSPGQTAATSFDVTPAAGLSTGTYAISVSAAAASHAAASGSVQYVFDASAPNAPTSLTASISRKTKIVLSWSAASDSGSGVARYDVYRNSTLIGSASTTSFTDTPPSGTLTYQVVAVDRAGNSSAPSNSASATIATRKR